TYETVWKSGYSIRSVYRDVEARLVKLGLFKKSPAPELPEQPHRPSLVNEFERHGVIKHPLDNGQYLHVSREDDAYFATWPTELLASETVDVSSEVLGLPREDQQGRLLMEPSLSLVRGSARFIADTAREDHIDQQYLRLLQLEYDGKREMLSWESRHDAWLGRKAIEAGFLFKKDKSDHLLELVYRTAPDDVRAQAVDVAKLLLR
ncbi:MAG TPA: hypothetical protein PLY16_02595, partial [Candidatus Saccharibacteria bacterium]|nr:hypothetical protein [Candidatus Saccharibacteria bacterium]